jgi:LDH2 family malate/lactate/ureidoglycolate dehydrogenase
MEPHMANETEFITLSLAEVHDLALQAFLRNGLSPAQSKAMADVIARAEGDEARSHGLYRVMGCVNAVRSGKVQPKAVPTVVSENGAAVRVNAHLGFANQAVELGREHLIAKARQYGVAMLAINDCYHFSALWGDIEPVAEQGLIAMSCTIGGHFVALADGVKRAIGTNPFAFAAPRGQGRHPFVFDISSSIAARGEVELHRRAGKPLPEGWGIDKAGKPTRDAAAVLDGAILPFGGHKGAAIGLMVELLAGPLIGDMLGKDAFAIDTGDGGPMRGGYVMIAIDPAFFGNGGENVAAADNWLASLERDHAPARLPSARRYRARKRSEEAGVQVDRSIYNEIKAI